MGLRGSCDCGSSSCKPGPKSGKDEPRTWQRPGNHHKWQDLAVEKKMHALDVIVVSRGGGEGIESASDFARILIEGATTSLE